MATNDLIPDKVYGLGGGGREMAFHFLEQEWLLEEIIRPRANRAEELDVHLIDTATEEKNGLVSRIEEIESRCEELRSKHRGTESTRPGEVTIEPTIVTDRMHRNTRTALTGDTEVRNIAEPNGMDPDNWWLSEDDIQHDLDFAKGVHRRRALGKATLYRAMAGREDIRSALDTPEPGRIAIFVGLGGGSGSGTLFDVIRELHESDPNNEITVFASLPSANEDSEGVHANAYAALCELEAMRLSENDPLEDVVLYHLDSTGYEGKEGDQLRTEGALQEFDEAFAQSVVAYYNADGEDQFNRTEPFAPFTVAIPQIAEYNVEDIEVAETLMEERLTAIRDMYEADRELISRAHQLFANFGISERYDSDLSDEDRVTVGDRLEALEALANEELFTELEYVASQRFEESLEDAKANLADGAEAVDIATELQHFATGLSNIDHESRGDIDSLLGDVLYLGIQNLANRTELLKRRQAVNDPTLRRQLGKFLRVPTTGRRDLEAAKASISGERKNIEGKLTSVEQDLESAQAELEERREKFEARLEESIKTWAMETDAARTELVGHDINRAEEGLEELRIALEAFSDEVQQANSKQAVIDADRGPVFEALDTIEQYETEVQSDPMDPFSLVDRARVENACETLMEARKLALTANESPGLLNRLFSQGDGGTGNVTAQTDLANCRQDLQEQGVFNLPNARDRFQVQVTLDIKTTLEELKRRVTDLEKKVVRTATEVHPDVPDDLSTDAEQRILTAVRQSGNARDTVRRVLADELDEDVDLKRRVDELESEYESLSERHERYTTVESLFESTLSNEYVDFTTAKSDAEEARDEYHRETTNIRGENEGAFKRTLQPENVISTASKDDLAEAELLNSNVERQVLEDVLDEFEENVLSTEYHGLQERLVEGKETAYYGTDINVGVVAPVDGQQIRSSMDLQSRLGGAFGVSAPGNTTKRVGVYQASDGRGRNIGPDWGLGVHVFISGVFLDNLLAVTDQRFRREYIHKTERESQHVRHAYRLEEGELVRRGAHRYARDDNDVEFYIGRDPIEVTDRIRTDLLNRVPVGDSSDVDNEASTPDHGTSTLDPEETLD